MPVPRYPHCLLLALALCAAVACVLGGGCKRAVPQLDTPYQAVLLDDGSVYIGKLEGFGSAYPVLREVYYIQQRMDTKTKKVSNVLVKRGQEWHEPQYMVLNADHVVYIEPVSPTSTVARLISEQRTGSPAPATK